MMITREKLDPQTHSHARPGSKAMALDRAASLLESLEQQRQNLLDKLRAEMSAMAQPVSQGDDGDYANKTVGQSKRMAMQRLWENMLGEVQRAITRVEQGTYGWCEGCGASIPEERLIAVPAAALCIGCARRQT